MSIEDIKLAKELKACGKALGREGLSKRVIELIEQFDGSYKGAIILAGRMKAITQACKFDGYWTEKMFHGYTEEEYALKRLAKEKERAVE